MANSDARPVPASGHRARMQALWKKAHLWVALVLGWVFVLLGLSGSVLALRAPVLKWEVGAAAVTLREPPAPGTPMASADRLKQASQAAYPQFVRVMGTAAPGAGFLASENAMVFGAVQGRGRSMGIAMMDPYTAQPRGFFVFDDLWLAKAVALHRSLLLAPMAGSIALALCGLALLASLVSGARLWWPRGASVRAWRLGLLPRMRGSVVWRGLHYACGGWLLPPLMVITTTGVWLARPDWFGASPMAAGRQPAPHALKPIMSALHGDLMLGVFGQIVVFATGPALLLLYVTGLAMWWRARKRKARHISDQVTSAS